MYVVVWVHKYNAMENNNKNSLLELQNSIETAESNKCSLLVLLCDKWHTSERFVKGEAEIWQLWWLVTNFLALLSVPWRRGWTTQKHVCICCTSFSLAHTQPPLTYTSSQKVLTLPFLPLSLSCADGGGNSTHAGWEKWHPHQNSEKFSNQDSQCFFRWVFTNTGCFCDLNALFGFARSLRGFVHTTNSGMRRDLKNVLTVSRNKWTQAHKFKSLT